MADYALNPEKYRTVERKRRAQMKGSSGTHTAADLAKTLKAQGHRCAYCRADLRRVKKHVDHIVPLALGGSNGPENLQYLCRPCNQSKSARHPLDLRKVDRPSSLKPRGAAAICPELVASGRPIK